MIAVEVLHIGGAEVVIQRIAHTIDRRLFNLTICCMKMRGSIGDSLAEEGFEIIVLSNPDKPTVRYLTTIKLLKLLRSRRIDIIHTHTTDAFFEAAVCSLLLPRIRLVHTFHFGNYPHITTQRKWMEGFGSRLADCAGSSRQRAERATACHIRIPQAGGAVRLERRGSCCQTGRPSLPESH